MKIQIVVKLIEPGIHWWTDCNVDECSFLKYPHRHNFHITCKKEVISQDREIEIISFKREISKHLSDVFGGNFDDMSCENIALYLLRKFGLSYCEVLEDGENGAEVIS